MSVPFGSVHTMSVSVPIVSENILNILQPAKREIRTLLLLISIVL